ncbi:hypothetical protein FHS29_005619 [Saccharothrix tamanrassetensis]|uniref:Uncharacterized protein n=1 Tax=Saccharothrix tamanrassetensis TaxID=1051531 RepID=A0A841CPA1_9PSEU|nr:hypothetical protein [Saccharothrix tamanrassetensis]MBB5959010.1 hypothetical protein [Saccharothrix tamanrassetensis]
MDTAKKGCLVNVLLFALGAIIGIGMTTVSGLIIFLSTTETISSDEGTPGVWVKKSESVLGPPEYEVWLGRSEDHGHVVEIPGGWDDSPEVVRQPDGVELRFDNGGRIFVPASAYLGGR